MTPIIPEDLKILLSDSTDGPILIDARENRQYQEKHIPGSISAPWNNEFEAVAKWALKDATSPIVVYDEHEKSQEAEQAGAKLEAMGYENVDHLIGGMLGWMEAGGTVEFGTES